MADNGYECCETYKIKKPNGICKGNYEGTHPECWNCPAHNRYKKVVFRGLLNARTIVNDGNNKRGMYLSGERCTACVMWIDNVLCLKEFWDWCENEEQ